MLERCECGHRKLEQHSREGCMVTNRHIRGANPCKCLHWYSNDGKFIRNAGRQVNHFIQRTADVLEQAFIRKFRPYRSE